MAARIFNGQPERGVPVASPSHPRNNPPKAGQLNCCQRQDIMIDRQLYDADYDHRECPEWARD
jgi:hypothetical protein